MDDIIVIIITVIIALVGILNKKKKKNVSQPAAVESTNESSDFWDMIMDGGNKAQDVNTPEYEEPEPEVEEIKKPVVKSRYQFSASNEGDSDIKDEIKKVVAEKKEITIEGEKFSLRKAVIYNEILNRKYS
jgi:hypothetical protein